MKTVRIQTRLASLVMATLLLLNIPALAGNLHEQRDAKEEFHGRVEVIFTKWITDFPRMEGLVSGDVGGGTFAGEILKGEHTTEVDEIEAIYHINGGAHHFTAHNHITQNNLKGTAVIT